MRIKQSLVLPCFHEKGADLAPLLAEAKRIGFVAAEIWHRDEELERTAALIHEHGLILASMCGHRDWKSGLNLRENHDRIEGELRASIDLAARLSIPGLVCFSGVCQPNDVDTIENTVVGLRRIAPYAEEKGVNLNLELLNSKVNHVGYEFDNTAWGVEVCRRVNSPRVKILYDIYHAQIMEGDVIRTIQENIDFIAHIHTAGNPGRNDLDDEQELNYAGICRAIAATNYAGYVGHEFFPKGDRLAAMRNAFSLCDVR